MGGQPCFLKMLQDGTRILNQAQEFLDFIKRDDVEIGNDDEAYKVIQHLIDSENALGRATKAVMESQGYHGPWPHALDFDKDYK